MVGIRRRKPREIKKKHKFNKEQIMTIFIAVLMIGSIGGFIYLGSGSEKSDYKGTKLLLRQEKWVLKNNPDLEFDFLPQEVEKLDIEYGVLNNLRQVNYIFITYDPDVENPEEIATSQYVIGEFFATEMQKFVANAMTKNNSFDFPIINCDNASQYASVFFIERGDNLSVKMRDGCVVMQGMYKNDFIGLYDALRYRLLGVI